MSTMKGVGTHVLAMLGVVLALSVAGLPVLSQNSIHMRYEAAILLDYVIEVFAAA